MPEGDALHRAARRLQVLVGEEVGAEAPHPRGAAVAALVDGRRLVVARAVGKNLLLEFDGDVVIRSHLRMRGNFLFSRFTCSMRHGPVPGFHRQNVTEALEFVPA